MIIFDEAVFSVFTMKNIGCLTVLWSLTLP